MGVTATLCTISGAAAGIRKCAKRKCHGHKGLEEGAHGHKEGKGVL